MTYARLGCVCAAMFSFALPVSSGELDYAMPSTFYDGMNAKLIGRGYREVRVLDPQEGILSAYDAQGSEVRINVDPTGGQIISTNYVHPADG
ncbi:hypothetical protein [Tropicimonas aquimaris]|uniref:PepSY domain-containing protein n=1 Tax=Tropicimonas aquimaris TaxID=914152 RepID=A0ABW3ITL6_9RHOB